jgi:predicted enzyme related to lactoylglutathione lyase
MLAAIGDKNIFGFVRELIVRYEFVGDRLAQLGFARRWAIAGFACLQGRDRRILNMRRRVKIRFTRTKAANIESFALHGICLRAHRQCQRRCDLLNPCRQFHIRSPTPLRRANPVVSLTADGYLAYQTQAYQNMDFVITRSLITIASIDWATTLTFYQDLLQQSPQVVQPDRYAEFQLTDCTIALYAPRLVEVPIPQPYPSLSLCLHVKSLASAIAQLESRNIAIPSGIQHNDHGQEIYIADPNGNRIILYEPNDL